jgi:putative nucleotidyltransferase with HDIG domain
MELQDPVFAALEQTAAEMGCSAWAVGGYVRDLVLGRHSTDLDIVVEGGRGIEMAERFSAKVGSHPAVIFERFGTAKAAYLDRAVEFVSARAESYSSDSRKPQVAAASVETDLRRRDFTINALLMTLTGEIDDRLGMGLEDLKAGVLRCPTDPDETFTDDPLRMLRAVRFAAQLGFSLHESVLEGIANNLYRLHPLEEDGRGVLSAERIRDELKKLLLSPRPALGLRLLSETGLLAIVLPEVAACQGVEQNRWHRLDVFEHTLEVVEGVPDNLTLRLAAMFHDVGKPLTRTMGEDGQYHFYEHENLSAQMAESAMRRLRFGNDEIDAVRRLCALHMRPVGYTPRWSNGSVRKFVREAGASLNPLLALASSDLAAGAMPERSHLEELKSRVAQVQVEEPERLSWRPDGNDIMQELNLAPGMAVGKVKRDLESLILEGALEPNREAVLEYLRSMAPEVEETGVAGL